jgi:Flp pilus assembly protein TadB
VTAVVIGLVAGATVGAGVFILVAARRLPVIEGLSWPGSRRTLLAAAVLAAVWLVTGWVAAVVVVGFGMRVLPRVLSSQAGSRHAAVRSEAVARWTELLRDNLAAGLGLEQAIAATARGAPTAIGGDVVRLAARLEHQSLPAAVRAFGVDLADPAGDLVVVALVTAASRQTSELVPLLGELAASTRDVAAMHGRIMAARAETWQAVRTITVAVIAFVALLAVISRPWLAPYQSPVGQLWLLLVGGGFVGGLWWLGQLAQIDAIPRTLAAGGRGGR